MRTLVFMSLQDESWNWSCLSEDFFAPIFICVVDLWMCSLREFLIPIVVKKPYPWIEEMRGTQGTRRFRGGTQGGKCELWVMNGPWLWLMILLRGLWIMSYELWMRSAFRFTIALRMGWGVTLRDSCRGTRDESSKGVYRSLANVFL
jgi:hypothetical protein